ITYLNRLSDLLFILSRAANKAGEDSSDEVVWVPGGERNPSTQMTNDGQE
ncbi:ATP:cob(I)alamin adenosyltransferase, partial [Xanthomonas citri pv. citri]|nr:ATP:cob(I)alamin adenosyltransferase [Xanthomonas citri pv. citri]